MISKTNVTKVQGYLSYEENVRGWAKLTEEKILKNIQKIYF